MGVRRECGSQGEGVPKVPEDIVAKKWYQTNRYDQKIVCEEASCKNAGKCLVVVALAFNPST